MKMRLTWKVFWATVIFAVVFEFAVLQILWPPIKTKYFSAHPNTKVIIYLQNPKSPGDKVYNLLASNYGKGIDNKVIIRLRFSPTTASIKQIAMADEKRSEIFEGFVPGARSVAFKIEELLPDETQLIGILVDGKGATPYVDLIEAWSAKSGKIRDALKVDGIMIIPR